MGHELNVTQAVESALPALNAASLATLTYLDADTLYDLIEDAGKDISSRLNLLAIDVAVPATPGTPQFSMQGQQVTALLFATSLGDRILKVSTPRELGALNPAWRTAIGDSPERITFDNQGLFTATVYPRRASGEWELRIMALRAHVGISAATPSTPFPSWMQSYFTVAALGAAATIDSEEAKPEMASFCDAVTGLWESALAGLYGTV